MTELTKYLLGVILLVAGSVWVFRHEARGDYQRQGRLRWTTSLLELVVCAGYFFFPYLFNPPCWAWLWDCTTPVSPLFRAAGLILVGIGMLGAFSSMAYLGIKRSFGAAQTRLLLSGPYRYSRNPQIVGGLPMVLGVLVLWPSFYALGWLALYFVIFHRMVLTEEEHLRRIFGEAFTDYCQRTPRYLPRPALRA